MAPTTRRNTRKLGPVGLIVVALLYFGLDWLGIDLDAPAPSGPRVESPAPRSAPPPGTSSSGGIRAVVDAWESKRSDVHVELEAEVVKTLPDDLKGSRHQRFLIEIRRGLTVLIAHNIDLAPRIDTLRRGDRVTIRGEYEWNDKGGVIHWTHHDPRGRREGGWIRHEGRLYE